MEVAPPGVALDGMGGARKRMKAANLSGPLMASTGVAASGFAVSLGTVANWQLYVSSRSWEKSSFEMPCSTLYASPAKISSDVFCAFQPKRVTVPSLPLVLGEPVILMRLGRPPMPSVALPLAVAVRLFRMELSG